MTNRVERLKGVEEIIQRLTETFGPSGTETHVRELIESLITGHVDELRTDALGNLITYRRATRGQSAGKIMLSAHMDEIGLIASYIDEKGFVRFNTVGGVSSATLIGSRVVFENGVVGVIGIEKMEGRSLPAMEKLYIDVGATSNEDCPVAVGDTAAFQRPFVAQGTRWIAKAMDDRVGCLAQIAFLRELEHCAYDVYVVFSTQEEVGLRGATVSAFGVEPDIALAIDVTATGDTPECHKMAMDLGKGAAIKVKDGGMIAHPGLRRHLVERAKAAGIPHQLEVLTAGSTDARAIQTTRAGLPTGAISIPTRYVHTPSEMVDAGDVRAVIDLLLRVVSEPMSL